MYDKDIIIQFKITGEHALRLGSADELDFRHKLETALDELLKWHQLGECDGGQIGSGSAEIFLYVDDVPAALKYIINYLTDCELIGFCKIASLKPEGKGYEVHYPKGATFSMWNV